MSLQFVVGNAGSGKSTYLFQYVIEEAMAHPKENYLVVVPEQFTLHTQKQLVAMHPGHSIMNIDVLSFERMAYRVFDELGTDTQAVLEETGKHLLLRKIAQEKRDEFSVLHNTINRPGTIAQVKSLISELMQYDISPEDFEEIVHEPGMQRGFSDKAQDILLLYKEYKERLRGHYITGEEVLQKLMEVAEESKILSGATVVFDGYTGFTPIQNQFLQMLLTLAKKVMVTVTIDSAEPLIEEPKEQELFAMSKKMTSRLIRMARQVGVEIDDAISMAGNVHKRFVSGGYLEHLEQNLFRPGAKPYLGQPSDQMEFFSFMSPRQELTWVACEIERQIREEGLSYKDFAVVCANMDSYAYLVPGIFEKLHIPYFLDEKTSVVFHPFIEAVKGLFNMLEEGFSYESVMRFLRTGMTDLSLEEVDVLDNYLLAAKIRGYKKYTEVFTFMPRGYEAEGLVRVNDIRQCFIAPFTQFLSNFSGKSGAVVDMSKALYEWMLCYELEEKLAEKASAFEAVGEEAKAREYQQIYGVVMDLLDKLVAIFGEEELSFTEYAELLATGFESVCIGVIPPGNDRVLIGDIERSRLDDVKVLYLIGACDGAIPKTADGGGMLSQQERMRLKEADYELAPTDREKAFMQRFYLYFVMTQPSNKLSISYARVDKDGKAMRRSYIFSTLEYLFPEITLQLVEELPISHQLLSAELGEEYLVETLRRYVEGEEVGEEFISVLRYMYENRPELLNQYVDSAYFQYKSDPLSQAAIDAVYGSELKESVSRLEQYARCAYAYFMKYGLGIQPREEYDFASVDVGNLYHNALEYYSKKLSASKEQNWYTISEEGMHELLQEAILDTYQTMTKTQVMTEARERYLLRRMEQTLSQTVWALTEQVRKGSFIPTDFEVDFRQVGELSALQYELDEMHSLSLRGKIDRVDLWENDQRVYVKIVDYKSGDKDLDFDQLYHGLQVQLVLYMEATMEGLKNKYPDKEVLPGAMFYYHVDRPLIDGGVSGQEAKEEALLKMLRMKGVLNRDDAVINAMDHGLAGASKVIPVKLKTDGNPDANSKVLSQEDFSIMGDYVRMMMLENGQRMIQGDISPTPCKLGAKTGCDYCEYHGICGFDPKLPGFAYRKLKERKNREEIIQLMKEDIEKHAKVD